MNKIKKFVLIPLAVIVAIIIVAVIVLSLVRVDALDKNFGGYSRVALLRSSDGNEFPEVMEENVNVTQSTLDDGLDMSDFSVIQAMLEGKFSYKLKAKSDKEKGDIMISGASIKTYGALEGEYVLKFYYDEVKTLKYGDKTIYYDRMLLRLYDSNGEVKEMDCVPYLEYNIDNQSIESEYDENGRIGSAYYTTNVFLIKMNTSRLMIEIKELLDKYY